MIQSVAACSAFVVALEVGLLLVPVLGSAQEAASRDNGRRVMVNTHLRARGIQDPAVLAAMARVAREAFVPPALHDRAYEDGALPIGNGQTISQPYVVAYMTEALQVTPDQAVLEIGTGSGYQAAVLAELARQVYSIEIIPELADRARQTLREQGYDNVEVRLGNGYLGWPEQAPFERIIVTAAPPEIPQALAAQLTVGGRMVVPVGVGSQEIVILTHTEDGVRRERTLPVMFVPMVDRPPDGF